jgi:hypothetical protein
MEKLLVKPDIYVSIDIEADGPLPGLNSMLSIGAAAFYAGNRTPVSTFEINIAPLEEASADPDTMQWWAKQDPKVWTHVTKDPADPTEAMAKFADWVRSLRGTPIMVVFPTWDFMWVHYYLVRFLGPKGTPFGIGALDIKSMAFGIIPEIQHYKEVTKRNMHKSLLEGCPAHTHQALDDALGQGVWFVNLLALRQPGQ